MLACEPSAKMSSRPLSKSHGGVVPNFPKIFLWIKTSVTYLVPCDVKNSFPRSVEKIRGSR